MCGVMEECVGGSITERPLGTIREERGYSSRFRVSISSRYGLSFSKQNIEDISDRRRLLKTGKYWTYVPVLLQHYVTRGAVID